MAQKVIPNPCKGICQMNTKLDICVGCYRNGIERSTWYLMDDDEQEQVLDLLMLRRARFGKLIPGNN